MTPTTVSTRVAAQDARGHSTATVYEAAQSEWRARLTAGDRGAGGLDPAAGAEVAVDPGIRAAWPGAAVAAPAFTVHGTGGDNLALHRAVAVAPAGSVLVADLAGAACGHWGEVLTVAAQQRQIAGLVIDGGVRDIDSMRRRAFAVFSRNDSVRGTRKEFPGRLGVPIRLGGVPVQPGDLVVGDTDGLVVLPRDRAAAVLDWADRRVAEERDIFEAIRGGRTTLDLYRLHAQLSDQPDRPGSTRGSA